MARYHARGTLTLKGVDFYIQAESIDAARTKARNGEYDDFEIDRSESVEWEIDVGSVEG